MNGVWLLLGAFTLMTILGVILQIVLIVRANRRKVRWKERRVAATIAKIEREIGMDRNQHWYVTATWTDVQIQRVYLFRSGPWSYLPPWHIGNVVIVAFDPSDPRRFRIE